MRRSRTFLLQLSIPAFPEYLRWGRSDAKDRRLPRGLRGLRGKAYFRTPPLLRTTPAVGDLDPASIITDHSLVSSARPYQRTWCPKQPWRAGFFSIMRCVFSYWQSVLRADLAITLTLRAILQPTVRHGILARSSGQPLILRSSGLYGGFDAVAVPYPGLSARRRNSGPIESSFVAQEVGKASRTAPAFALISDLI